jgi:hypothetical protein
MPSAPGLSRPLHCARLLRVVRLHHFRSFPRVRVLSPLPLRRARSLRFTASPASSRLPVAAYSRPPWSALPFGLSSPIVLT